WMCLSRPPVSLPRRDLDQLWGAGPDLLSCAEPYARRSSVGGDRSHPFQPDLNIQQWPRIDGVRQREPQSFVRGRELGGVSSRLLADLFWLAKQLHVPLENVEQVFRDFRGDEIGRRVVGVGIGRLGVGIAWLAVGIAWLAVEIAFGAIPQMLAEAL